MNDQKKLLSAYKVFTPRIYTIAYVGFGTLLLCSLAGVMKNMMVAESLFIIIAALMMLSDIMCDILVFQGILSKRFNFGLLANSYYGYGALKSGILSDQIRRLLQITIVIGTAGCYTYADFVNNGYFSNKTEYVGFLSVVILTIYCGNTLVLHITRKYENFVEGMMFTMLCNLLEGVMLTAVTFMFFRDVYVNPIPLLLPGILFAIVLSYSMMETVGLRYKDSFGERKAGRFGDDYKRKMIVFLSVAFGVDFLMIPVMVIGFRDHRDLSVFLIAQMMYPACGVVLAKMFSYNEGKLPKVSYLMILFLGAVCILFSVLSVTVSFPMEMNGMDMDGWTVLANGAVIIADIIFLIAVIAAGKEKRENAGYRFHNPGKSVLMVLLYIVLYIVYMMIELTIYAVQNGDWSVFGELWTNLTGSNALVGWIGMLINLPLTIIIFFGEEYGWRYFLQPKMQKRFGVTLGTILLGVVWGIWHCGADFMYYSVETGPQMLAAQIIACISMGIFFGYAYMKTQNIWVPVLMHFINNNMVPVISGQNSMDAFQGKVIGWDQIPFYIIGYAVMWLFIFTPTMRGKGKTTSTNNILTEAKEA